MGIGGAGCLLAFGLCLAAAVRRAGSAPLGLGPDTARGLRLVGLSAREIRRVARLEALTLGIAVAAPGVAVALLVAAWLSFAAHATPRADSGRTVAALAVGAGVVGVALAAAALRPPQRPERTGPAPQAARSLATSASPPSARTSPGTGAGM